ncbi:GNAT family N-acetyltransferase [Burkholderia alba]|uniref:GNAT family N-acetyltransferase n=1 Tax=Burkholderia alba TaxID=2683677 RepID=UPI002B0547BD|nr:GNAT family N-acetyltransferase [Burkholderia alba]
MIWSTVEIRTARLTIRPFTAADADDAFACVTPSLTRYMAFDPEASPAAFEAIWRRWLATIDAGEDFSFAIRDAQTGGFVGMVGLHHARAAVPELGIWIREDRHGHAYGREAVTAVAQWGARTFKPDAFIYPVAERNHPSRRIAESLGGVVVETRTTPKYEALVYRIPAAAPCAAD